MTSKLFTTYYPETRRERKYELDLSLAINASSFDRLYVLAEKVDGQGPNNCEWRFISKRQTYADVLSWAASVAGDDDIIILANCDIIIPKRSVDLIAENLNSNEAYCLARYEIRHGGASNLYDTDSSQDVWAFRGKPPCGIADWFFGIPGCENHFARELHERGFKVMNPARDIQTIHVHQSAMRTETNSGAYRLPPPYLFVSPSKLGEPVRSRLVGVLSANHREATNGRT